MHRAALGLVTSAIALIAAFGTAPRAGRDGGPPLGAQPPVAQVGGASKAVAYFDGLFFIGVGPRVAVLEAPTGAGVVLRGISEPLPGVVKGIAVDGPTAYAGVTRGEDTVIDGGLAILDVGNKAAPTQLSYLPLGAVHGVAAQGGVAYVVGAKGRQHISDPFAPRKTDIVLLAGKHSGIAAGAGSRPILVAAGEKGLYTLDPATRRSGVAGAELGC